MKLAIGLLATVATGVAATPVLAVQPAYSLASEIPLDRLCNAKGTLALSFGSIGDAPRRSGMREPVTRKLDASLKPFEEAKLTYSRFSNTLVSSGFVGTYYNAAGAAAAADQLAEQAKAQKWFLLSEPDDESELYEYSFSSKPAAGDPPLPDETTLTLSVSEDTLVVSCENAVQSLIQFDEVIGKMPVGMKRPVFTDYATEAVNFSEQDCDDPVKRDALENAMDEDGRNVFAPNFARVSYEDDLASWKIMRLTSSGKISFDTIMDGIVKLLDTPATQQSLEESNKILMEFGDDMEKINPADEAGMCRVMFKMSRRTDASLVPDPNATGEAITRPWRQTHELLDNEAKRLGVSFDS
jgi:hypothetical protein